MMSTKKAIDHFKKLMKKFQVEPRLRVWSVKVEKYIQKCSIVLEKLRLSAASQKQISSRIRVWKRMLSYIKLRRIKELFGMKSKNTVEWRDGSSAFANRIRTGLVINKGHKELDHFLEDVRKLFKTKVSAILAEVPLIKVNANLCADFKKEKIDGDITDKMYFNTHTEFIDLSTDIESWFNNNVVQVLQRRIEEFSDTGSGWTLSEINVLEISINKYEIGNGSSYIKLPNDIMKKRAIINVKNEDEACFFWSVVSALFPAHQNQHRTSSYPDYHKVLKTEGLELPLKLTEIDKFEKMNEEISVNVFGLQKGQNRKAFETVPIRLTNCKRAKHVNLLRIQDEYNSQFTDDETSTDDEENKKMKYHYCWIKNLSRLISSQLNNHQHKKYLCDRCLNYFSTEIILNKHYDICVNINDVKVSFPKFDYVEFKNHIFKLECPFVIYADFECLLEKNEDEITEKLKKYQKHQAFSAGFYLKCSFDENLSRFRDNRSGNCMNWFVDELAEIAKEVTKMMTDIKPMDVSDTITSSKCHICEKDFNFHSPNSKSEFVVRDHDHFTGKFRGYAHNSCNLNFRKQFVIPIFFHNLSGYDSHFIIRELVKRGAVTVLPVNKDKYISFTYADSETKIRFRFVDSYRFLSASLDELVSTLSPYDLKIIRREFKHLDDETFQLLTRKGVFPYDYIDNIKKLEEPNLPAKRNFYNKLTDANVDDREYRHAQSVWEKFRLKTLGEYCDLYMKTDILLLADVMENFRATAFKTYGLDPAWSFTLPGYTWQCMLKYTGCKLRILKDVDMLMFIEKSIRGGISVCTHRYSEANNKYMEDFDPSKLSKYILYLDVNNLYGFAMTQYLPYDEFEWTDTHIDVTKVPDDSPEGYILEVDLEYPQNLHNLHKDFPFCPEHRPPPGSNLKKLMTTLFDKKEYVLHYRNLKQALKNGLILKKIHRVLKFKQTPWLKPYIDLNSKLRKNAVSTFAKNQYKLANNAVYGKTMENVRRYRDVKLVSKWKGRYGAKNLIASPRFKSRTIFGDDLVAIELKRAEIVFDKPLYIGMAILDISKSVMYDFHYDFMLRIFEVEHCKILYMDTDSFLYELACGDAYEHVIKNNIEYFDTSDYSKDNIYNIPLKNKKVPGLMKDETNGEIITHYAGLRSKMYAYKVQSGRIAKKAKGVKKHIVKNKITFEDYVYCLRNNTVKEVSQRSIRSFDHTVYSIEQSKIGLSAHDDKRQIIPGSFETLPWGYMAQDGS